jgi:hypothetical protein
MARLDWEAFVRGLREEQDELREELRPYEAGTPGCTKDHQAGN